MSQSISSLGDFLEIPLVPWDAFIPYSVRSCFSLAIGELDSPFSRWVGVPTQFFSSGRFQRVGRYVLFLPMSAYELFPVVETGFKSFPAFVAGFSLGEGTSFRPFLCASLSWLAFLKTLYCKLVAVPFISTSDSTITVNGYIWQF